MDVSLYSTLLLLVVASFISGKVTKILYIYHLILYIILNANVQ